MEDVELPYTLSEGTKSSAYATVKSIHEGEHFDYTFEVIAKNAPPCCCSDRCGEEVETAVEAGATFTYDVCSATLSVENGLDREVYIEYQLKLTATGVNFGEEYETTLYLTLGDVNDNSPYFHDTPYSASVTEADQGSTELLLIEASDRDDAVRKSFTENADEDLFTSANGYVTYEITDGDDMGQFELRDTRNPSTSLIEGTVKLFTSGVDLDREDLGAYTLTITACDGGSPERTDVVPTVSA